MFGVVLFKLQNFCSIAWATKEQESAKAMPLCFIDGYGVLLCASFMTCNRSELLSSWIVEIGVSCGQQ